LSQSSLFLPKDSNTFYFITPSMSDARFADCNALINCYFDLLLYNVIDMNANGGAGKVTKRMQPLMQNGQPAQNADDGLQAWQWQRLVVAEK
jgi:hypothetical protein